MILNELVLQNVGTFAGRQVIDLSPPDGDRPIVLVGGLNGAGKTTILESIQLALYGPHAQPAGRRGSGGYENGYLRGLIHRGVSPSEGAAVELTFSAYQEGTERTYWVRRKWRKSGKQVNELLTVFVDGMFDEALTSTWSEHVETFLPRGIAGLFFFDGEQIEALADLDRSREVLGSALAALLGLDLVDRLATDLTVLKRRQRVEQIPESTRALIEQKRIALTSLQQVVQRDSDDLATRRVEAETREQAFGKTSAEYRQAGGNLLEQREAAEVSATNLRHDITECEEEIRAELANASPLLQLRELLEQLTLQVQREDDARRNNFAIEVIANRDKEILEQLAEVGVSDKAFASVQKLLATDLEARKGEEQLDEIIGITDLTSIQTLASRLPIARSRLAELVGRHEALKSDLAQYERVLAAIPDAETVLPFHKAREDARAASLRAEASVELATARLEASRLERDRASAAYDSALDKAAEANFAVEDSVRLADHLGRVQETLKALRTAATRRHLQRISALIMEALAMLMRKEQLISDVTIDPETFSVTLTGKDNRVLDAGKLSAGERQLLAVALLWGLARAAGQPLPVVIDTPLGRLDGTHREHLLDRYFPLASHQVVMLSTDTEIDEAAYHRMGDRVGRAYRLEFDHATDATSIKRGYFWD